MIITVGGLAGTGTTTTAEGLSEKLNIPYISAGFVFREMAAEKGMSVLEFSEFAEGNDDIDKEIDNTMLSLKVNNYTSNVSDIEYDIIIAKGNKEKLSMNY